MKQKPDEMPDEWVRQTLRRLPDAPPPGSSFDKDRLWATLRPELQKRPDRRKVGWAWSAAAACLAGLALGWFWPYPSTDDQNIKIAHHWNRKVDTPKISHPSSTSADEIATSKPIDDERKKLMVRQQTVARHRARLTRKSIPQLREPTEVIPQLSESPAVTEVPVSPEKLPELPKPKKGVVIAKRRFRVIHENELRAEEETRPKIYHTENFVRLGTGRSEEPEREERRPALTLPLTHKSNQ